MEIRQSAEDYLESILVLSKKGGGVRSIDIATRLGVSKPSVSHAMKLLREDGYIAMDRYGTVTLLEKGAEIANQIYERHIVLARMLEGNRRCLSNGRNTIYGSGNVQSIWHRSGLRYQ